MCLLIHHRADTVFPKSFLADVYEKNSDGFGAMVSVNGSISVVKSLAKLDDIYQIYNEMIVGREAVMHFRMRTHGEIDIDNYLAMSDKVLPLLEEPFTSLSRLKGLVVIDEVQRRPELFPTLRVLLDRSPLPARFLAVSSVARRALPKLKF